MIGLVQPEEWLVTQPTLSRWGSELKEQQQQYAAYVEHGLIEDIENPTKTAIAQSIIGRDRFVNRVRRIMRARTPRDGDSNSAQRQLSAETLDTVLRRVAHAYGVRVEELTAVHRGRQGHEARAVAMWLAQECCGAARSARVIGKAMGGVSGSAVIAAHGRVNQMITRNKRLARLVRKLL